MNRRPLLFLVYTNSLFAAGCSRFFRRRGWNVKMAAPAENLLRIIDELRPTAVVIDAGSDGGHRAAQTCSHIQQHNPGLTVVVSTADQFSGDDDATFQGDATVVVRNGNIEGAAEQVMNVLMTPAV